MLSLKVTLSNYFRAKQDNHEKMHYFKKRGSESITKTIRFEHIVYFDCEWYSLYKVVVFVVGNVHTFEKFVI